jgi:hypothetical protein
MAGLPGARGVSDSRSDLTGRRGSEPVDGFGIGHEQRLRLVGGAVLNDLDAARVRAGLRGGAGDRSEALPGSGRASEDGDYGQPEANDLLIAVAEKTAPPAR